MIARLLLLFMPLSLALEYALKASQVRVTSTPLIAIVPLPGDPSPQPPKT